MRFLVVLLVTILSLTATNTQALSFEEFSQNFLKDVKSIWNEGDYDVYIPFRSWHNRWAYDDDHIYKYNEKAFGFGLGKSHYDEKGNWSGLYAFGFKDSNYKFETVFGYGYLYNWDLSDNWHVGAGYTLGFTQRHEYGYIPVPMPLPLAEINYKHMMSLQMAYVPGLRNWGNVALLWVRAKLQ